MKDRRRGGLGSEDTEARAAVLLRLRSVCRIPSLDPRRPLFSRSCAPDGDSIETVLRELII